MYFIQINDKGGGHYRTYTEKTLQAMFDVSPSAANFEMMVLIEGLVFTALFSHHALQNNEQQYYDYARKKPSPSLGNCISRLRKLRIFEDSVLDEVDKYRDMRNDLAHDFFKLKSHSFTQTNNNDLLKALFEQGLKVFTTLLPLIVPSQPNKHEYLKSYKATKDGISNPSVLGFSKEDIEAV